MFRKFILPVLAIAGVVFAIFEITRGDKSPPPAPPFAAAAQTPYQNSVAGSGLVEASTENISIGTQIAGIVSKIFVQIGGEVKAGDPLFAIDDRALRAELATRRAAAQVAEAQLADASYDFTLAEKLVAKDVSPTTDREKKRLAVQKAEAQLAQARAELNATETNLERLTVHAPVNGQVLQLKVHLGEFAADAAASTGQPPLVLLGGVTPLNVRVDVDENDAWRIPTGAPATGYLRGHKEIKAALKFVRFEPYVVPKKSLTGDSTERVDTRVLQVIFSFERGNLPVYVGQQMDVFIDGTGRSSSP
ncbi:MAG: efflux RND transporter periplasmic adaptor subunit [Opitutus sp.]